jgi:hypothetical protein
LQNCGGEWNDNRDLKMQTFVTGIEFYKHSHHLLGVGLNRVAMGIDTYDIPIFNLYL